MDSQTRGGDIPERALRGPDKIGRFERQVLMGLKRQGGFSHGRNMGLRDASKVAVTQMVLTRSLVTNLKTVSLTDVIAVHSLYSQFLCCTPGISTNIEKRVASPRRLFDRESSSSKQRISRRGLNRRSWAFSERSCYSFAMSMKMTVFFMNYRERQLNCTIDGPFWERIICGRLRAVMMLRLREPTDSPRLR